MLVQKQNSDQNASLQIPKIKVRVKYGSSFHELNINPQANFGELKKMLAGPTRLHPQDQKLMYKDRDRDSKVFLDVAGVSDGSKIELVEDVMRQERRVLESRKNDKMDKASKAIAEIGLDVDNLAKQVMPPLWCRLDGLWFPHPGILPGTMTRQPFLCPMDNVFAILLFSGYYNCAQYPKLQLIVKTVIFCPHK